MAKIEKETRYVDENGEYLIEPKEVVKMTPELEKELANAVELVQKCGFYITNGEEINKYSMEYSSKGHAILYLFIIAIQLFAVGLFIYKKMDLVAYLTLGLILLFLYAIYKIIKEH